MQDILEEVEIELEVQVVGIIVQPNDWKESGPETKEAARRAFSIAVRTRPLLLVTGSDLHGNE